MFVHSPYEMSTIVRNLDYTTEAYEFQAYSIELISDVGLLALVDFFFLIKTFI